MVNQMKRTLFFEISLLLFACIFNPLKGQTSRFIHPDGKTIETRIAVPSNFKRVSVPENSFADYLRHLPLKPNGAQVRLYDGRIKPTNDVYVAVVDLGIGRKNLHLQMRTLCSGTIWKRFSPTREPFRFRGNWYL